MTIRLTSIAVVLSWLVLSAGTAHGQQSAVQHGVNIPAETLDLQVRKPAEPPREDDSDRQAPVMTHGLTPDPGKPESPEAQQTRPPGNNESRETKRETASRENKKTHQDQDTGSDHRDSPASGSRLGDLPALGSRTPEQRTQPSARDLARYGRGNLLNRPPTGFAPLRKRDRPAPGMDIDPDADFEPCELLVMSENMAEAQRISDELSAMSIDIRRRVVLAELGMVLSVFCVPEPGQTEQTLDTLIRQYPSLTVALNHRYIPAAERSYYAKAIGWRDNLYVCGSDRRIGLVDTGVDLEHRAFAGARVTTRNLLGPGTRAADTEHGTATASVLAGASGEAPGLVRTADLVAVNVFRQRSGSNIDTNAELLLRAIDWLLGEHVELINMSLAGPANRLLEHAVQSATASGVIVVAAAGNSDHNPAFPAAYPEVIAVTAVDAQARVYASANRGDYIDFAAPGVDLFLAAPGDRGKYYSGTSFAAPFVTAALAVMKSRDPEADADTLLEQLTSAAADLGDPDRDPIFGWGLVQAPADCTGFAARE